MRSASARMASGISAAPANNPTLALKAPAGLSVNCWAGGLDHARWFHQLPSCDVLAVEARSVLLRATTVHPAWPLLDGRISLSVRANRVCGAGRKEMSTQTSVASGAIACSECLSWGIGHSNTAGQEAARSLYNCNTHYPSRT